MKKKTHEKGKKSKKSRTDESQCKHYCQISKYGGIAQTMPYFGSDVLIDSKGEYPFHIAVVILHVSSDSHFIVDVHCQEQKLWLNSRGN